VSLNSAGVEVSELEAGWRILVCKEFQRKEGSRTEGALTHGVSPKGWRDD